MQMICIGRGRQSRGWRWMSCSTDEPAAGIHLEYPATDFLRADLCYAQDRLGACESCASAGRPYFGSDGRFGSLAPAATFAQ